jgi:hypothetical protein
MEIVNDPTSPTCLWVSPDGAIYEFRYIVTMTEAEGPERLEFRLRGDIIDLKDPGDEWLTWSDLPADQGEPPKEVIEHFHGKLVKQPVVVGDMLRLPSVDLDVSDESPRKQGFHVNWDGEPALYVTVEFVEQGEAIWRVGTMSLDGREGQEVKFVEHF